MTRGTKSQGSRVSVPVFGAFAEMPSDMDALSDVIVSARNSRNSRITPRGTLSKRQAVAVGPVRRAPLAAEHIQLFSTSAAGAVGMYKQRIRTAWATQPAWGGPASCLTAAGASSSMHPG